MIDQLKAMFPKYQFVFDDEVALQNQIAEMLVLEKVHFLREASLSRGDRPDFLLENESLVLEVKVAGTAYNNLSQIKRYAEHAKVKTLLLVCSRMPAPAPATLNGKPLHYIVVRGF